jgi:hypothetical protein
MYVQVDDVDEAGEGPMSANGDSRLESEVEGKLHTKLYVDDKVMRHGEVESKVVVQICMQPYMLVLSHAGTPAGSMDPRWPGHHGTAALGCPGPSVRSILSM